MRARRRLLSTDDGLGHIWPSYADVTSTFALVLFVLVLLAYIENLISGKRLAAYQQEIAASEQKLASLEAALRATTQEIEAGQRRLRLSEQQLEVQAALVTESRAELDRLKARLSGIALLRVDVLNKVKSALERGLAGRASGDVPVVTIGDNGNIVINEGLVFEYNSYAIKPEGKPLLDTLARALGDVLGDPNVRDNIDAIVVQGHTDERGSSTFNRELSARRAGAVLDYLFQANPVLESDYGAYFTSSAFSEFRPIDQSQSEAAYQQNRRIEIAVALKDANVRRVIDDYMQSADPTLEQRAPSP